MRKLLTAPSLAGLVALTFLAVGIAGFIPGLTQDYTRLHFWKGDSQAQLLGLFETSTLHNLVHITFGVAGIVLARGAATARWYLLGGGAVYLGLWVYGLAIDKGSSANFAPLDRADDWLHFLLGVLMVALGLLATRLTARQPATSS